MSESDSKIRTEETQALVDGTYLLATMSTSSNAGQNVDSTEISTAAVPKLAPLMVFSSHMTLDERLGDRNTGKRNATIGTMVNVDDAVDAGHVILENNAESAIVRFASLARGLRGAASSLQRRETVRSESAAEHRLSTNCSATAGSESDSTATAPEPE